MLTHFRPRRARAQSQGCRRRYPARDADGDHRPVGIGQVLAWPSTPSMPRASAATSRSLSAYARQFLEMMQKPDVDHIEGLSPAISIEQKTTSRNPRSTVATVTEIYDYMRLLWARVGVPYCPGHRPAHLRPDRQPDGRPGDAAARRHPPLSARPGRPRPQGRISQGAGRMAESRLHPRPHRRRHSTRSRTPRPSTRNTSTTSRSWSTAWSSAKGSRPGSRIAWSRR